MNSQRTVLVALVGLLTLAPGCAPEQYRVAVAPSLQPVDTARPRVVFSQARGEACGRDAVAGALRDLDRFVDADGFVEVVIEGTGEGDERCVRAVARPFRYGTSTESLTLRPGDPPTDPVLVPGRDAEQPAADFCQTECRRVVDLVGGASVASELEYQRCLTRCNEPDAAFRVCIEVAETPAAASACLEGAPNGDGADVGSSPDEETSPCSGGEPPKDNEEE